MIVYVRADLKNVGPRSIHAKVYGFAFVRIEVVDDGHFGLWQRLLLGARVRY